MKQLKKQIDKIDKEFFEKVNRLLKENGIDDAEIVGLKITSTNIQCPPDKTLYCWTDVLGRKHCRCIKKSPD